MLSKILVSPHVRKERLHSRQPDHQRGRENGELGGERAGLTVLTHELLMADLPASKEHVGCQQPVCIGACA